MTVFGSAKCKAESPDYRLAYEIGQVVGGKDLSVCNGGYMGTMEASAKGASEFGVERIGITLQEFTFPANDFITEEIRAENYWERLQHLIQKGDCYVVLKGGTGTLVEVALIAELMLKDFSELKPIFIYEPFWKPMIEMLREEVDAPDPRFSDLGDSKINKVFTFFSDAEEFKQKFGELLN